MVLNLCLGFLRGEEEEEEDKVIVDMCKNWYIVIKRSEQRIVLREVGHV